MIRVNLFSFEMTSTERKINRYINNNLKVMIEVYREYLYMDDGYSIDEKLYDAFPREFLKQNRDEFIDIIEELYEILSSQVIRDYIRPKYEAVLYYIIHWWIEIHQGEEENYIPIALDEKLIEVINNSDYYESEEGVKVILERIKDIHEYLEFCFEDHDFLQDSLDSIVSIYLMNSELVEYIFHIDLDEYIELMSADMRELYIKRRDENKKNNNNITLRKWSEELLVKDIYNSLKLLNEHVIEIKGKSEVEISNEIFRMIKLLFKKLYGLEVERESEIGHATKKLGENDFFIYQNSNEYIEVAIGENKMLEGFKQAYGQLLGYLNYNFKFGFTISINKNKSIKESYEYILKQLNDYNYDNFKLTQICKNPFGKEYMYLIKSTHILPEDEDRKMDVYHLILDLNDEYRQKVAIDARK